MAYMTAATAGEDGRWPEACYETLMPPRLISPATPLCAVQVRQEQHRARRVRENAAARDAVSGADRCVRARFLPARMMTSLLRMRMHMHMRMRNALGAAPGALRFHIRDWFSTCRC